MHTIIAILVFVAVVGITLVLFGGWVIVSVVRMIVRAFTGGGRAPETPLGGVRCARERCHAVNPSRARFCRRCGVALDGDGVAFAALGTRRGSQPAGRAAAW